MATLGNQYKESVREGTLKGLTVDFLHLLFLSESEFCYIAQACLELSM